MEKVEEVYNFYNERIQNGWLNWVIVSIFWN